MTEQLQALVVDDEAGIRFFLEEVLRQTGYTVLTAASGEEALERLRVAAFDLVMLDLRLGGRVDGLRVMEAVRWRWPDTAVVILTAHATLESALAAIREGVDGYLVKPAEAAQVRQAVQEALARRNRCLPSERPAAARILVRGDLTIDLERYQATLAGRVLDLTAREFGLLAHLVQKGHRVVSPKELVRVVQGYEAESEWEAREIIKWYIHRLRWKLGDDAAHPQYIVNVRGVGYRFGE
jgi:DNA-binding response OmpR family regulator